MMFKMKQIGLLLATMSAMLVLFAGCGDNDDGSDSKESLAQLAAATVSSSTTTNKISTQGPAGLTFEAQIVSQSGDADWCSFDLNTQLSDMSGNVGDPAYLYLKINHSETDRTAQIDVTYSNGYSTSLALTQKASGSSFGYDKAWGEQPEYLPETDYTYKTYYTTLASGRYVRNYSICYDRTKHVSRWVAYPIHNSYTSSRGYQVGTTTQGRTDAWAYDDWTTEYSATPQGPYNRYYYRQTGTKIFEPAIAESDQANVINYFSGYQRGHMLPSASRYSTWTTNSQTFFATNMMPQNGDFNGGSWQALESKVRSWGGLNKYDTLFVVTGTYFSNAHRTMVNENVGGTIRVAVPDKCWKVLLRQRGNQNKQISEFGADELKAIAFIFDNSSSSGDTKLRDAACTVKEIEEMTGFTFFRNLDPAVADVVKDRFDPSDWSGL